MKKVLILTLAMGIINGGEFKLYNVKSGKVIYKINGNSNIMGSTQTINGKKKILFDKYGYRELDEESMVTVMNIFGNKQKSSSHKKSLRVKDRVKIADFKQKIIYENTIPMMSAITSKNRDMVGMGEKMLKKMGGKKIGTKKILGYKCDMWKMPTITECLYKGVPLMITSNIMGVKQKTIAIEAKFDIKIDNSQFQLPKFKIQKSISMPTGSLNLNQNKAVK